MLMFPKVSIKSFVCDIIDVFMFPNETTKSIYEKCNIEKCYVYQCLTDTDSTSINFIFICDFGCIVDEKNARKIIFEVMITSKILKRLDLSDEFWAQFDVQDKKLKKQVDLFEAESINIPNVITISINPKEYLEEFEDLSINKKQKVLKKVLQVWTSALTVRTFLLLLIILSLTLSKIKRKLNKKDLKLSMMQCN